ncbi:MAG: methyltransferase domain-containing protein [Alphaproteobacteria bacterium]|nr:methyltransferase domain-containing protein [Alphaproteobacteria bacterium]
MNKNIIMNSQMKINYKETLLFFRRWLRHPLRLGAVIPSSPALTRLVCRQIALKDDRIIVELGAGTGCLTRMLLEMGIPHDRLYVVELDPELCEYLKKTMPTVNVIQGNACDLAKLLPSEWVGKVSTVISGMPMTAMPKEVQRKIIDASFAVMDHEGELFQYTYRPMSPLAASHFGLSQTRVGVAFRNLPPATVWRYQRLAA